MRVEDRESTFLTVRVPSRIVHKYVEGGATWDVSLFVGFYPPV